MNDPIRQVFCLEAGQSRNHEYGFRNSSRLIIEEGRKGGSAGAAQRSSRLHSLYSHYTHYPVTMFP